MAKKGKICMELPFNRNISYSQRAKTKDFWNFLDNESNLKPYEVSSEIKASKISGADQLFPTGTKRIWYDQFKVFQEHKLDQVALAAYEECGMCSNKFNCGPSTSTDTKEQSYEELLQDMRAFDKKLDDKTETIKKK